MIPDALRPAEDASYEAQLARPAMTEADAALAAEMIGRPLRGRSAVAVRCGWGLPAVLRVAPRLEDGTPFPTLFWLSCPLAHREVGRLEASGVMRDLTARLEDDEPMARQYRAAHGRYVAARDQLGPAVPGDPSAGGMPGRVKCLHALYGHHLATRDNPVGAWVAEQIEPMPCPAPCVGPGTQASASEPVGGDQRARASVSEPVGGDRRARASASEPVGGDLRAPFGRD
jgi:hypothetical protein